MKKVLLILVVALLGVTAASAQFEKGTRTIAARTSAFDLSFGNDETNFNIGLGGSYFIINNLGLKAEIGFNYMEVDGGDDINSFNFGVGADYFFYKFFYGGLGFDFSKVKGSDFGVAIQLEAGLRYYVVNNVFVNPAIYYYSGFGTNDRSNFGIQLGIGVNF
jgi:hypothetical protein